MDSVEASLEEPLPWKEILPKAVHDMRTPLSSMRVTLEILRMTCGESEAHGKLIAMMEKQVNELAVQLHTLATDPAAVLSR
ncbi:MAG: histidine kinase dimerization/phospho-acceptor domain-containing protein [Verrucomicrobiota bacterium]